MKKEYKAGKLMNVFDELYEEAEKDYNRMPATYRESITLEDHQENYIREQANKKLNKH